LQHALTTITRRSLFSSDPNVFNLISTSFSSTPAHKTFCQIEDKSWKRGKNNNNRYMMLKLHKIWQYEQMLKKKKKIALVNPTAGNFFSSFLYLISNFLVWVRVGVVIGRRETLMHATLPQ